MAMEKRGGTGDTDVRLFIKKADAEEAVLVLNCQETLNGKAAVAVYATGPRAEFIQSLLKQAGIT
jgi:hypothetical protein